MSSADQDSSCHAVSPARIGLEIHLQLATATKLFCACARDPEAAPNRFVCETCLGLPGGLPSLNLGAVERALALALALGAEPATASEFDRKCYLYPDLPKGYQITQKNSPLASGGRLEFDLLGEIVHLEILEIHLEEDSAKLDHLGSELAIDYNRSGAPLVEIVTAPQLDSGAQAAAAVHSLARLARWIGVSDARAELGELRVDLNISIDDSALPEHRSELKNLSGRERLRLAADLEIERLQRTLQAGGPGCFETRHVGEDGHSRPSRVKSAHDGYRFDAEPDLPPLVIGPSVQALARRRLERGTPETFLEEAIATGLDLELGRRLAGNERLAGLWREVIEHGIDPGLCARGLLDSVGPRLDEGTRLDSRQLASWFELAEEDLARSELDRVLELILSEGGEAQAIAAELGLLDGEIELEALLDRLLLAEPSLLGRLEAGDTRLIGYLVGQLRSTSQGRARPRAARRLIESRFPALARTSE